MVIAGQPRAPRLWPLLAAGLTLLVLGAVPSVRGFPGRAARRPDSPRPVPAAPDAGAEGTEPPGAAAAPAAAPTPTAPPPPGAARRRSIQPAAA